VGVVAAAAAGRGGHDLDETVEEAEEDLVDGEEVEVDGYVYDCRGMEVASHDEVEAEEWRSL
jgi:hypothetical protein